MLFAHVREVMLLAADRAGPNNLEDDAPQEVRRAARFFVRSVLLRAGGTHYDVLGAKPGDDMATLRDHYRLLIRMTHPDFAGEGEAWPDDAAARVNRAYDVLSSPGKRAEYDAQLKAKRSPEPVAGKATVRSTDRKPVRVVQSRKKLGAYFAGALAVGVLGVLASLWHSPDDVSLGAKAGSGVRLLRLAESTEAWPPESVADAGVRGSSSVVAPLVRAQATTQQKPKASTTAATLVPQASPEPRRPQAAVAETTDREHAMLKGEATVSVSAPLSRSDAMLPVPVAAPVARQHASAADGDPAVSTVDIRAFQPVLMELLQMLETGEAERVQQWAARATRQDASASEFADAYRQLLGEGGVTGLGQVRFDLNQGSERPVVRGWVQLRMLDRNQQTMVRDFRLRAQFLSRTNGPQLTTIHAE